jgi:hypothetical protein
MDTIDTAAAPQISEARQAAIRIGEFLIAFASDRASLPDSIAETHIGAGQSADTALLTDDLLTLIAAARELG